MNKTAVVFAAVCLAFAGGMYAYDKAPAAERVVTMPEFKEDTRQHVGFVEDAKTEVENIPAAPPKEDKEKKGKESEASNKIDMTNVISVNNRNYYLFNDAVLLPLSTSTWREYPLPKRNIGAQYGKITEYCVTGENVKDWTQKFTMHEVLNGGNDCFDFIDKLVTGIIVSVSGEMESKQKELTTDNLLFSFVKKEKSETVLFWTKQNIEGSDDETQFLRCFLSRDGSKMYLAAYTLKLPQSALSEQEISSYIHILNEIRELKKKEEPK